MSRILLLGLLVLAGPRAAHAAAADDGFVRLLPPHPGEWRQVFPERVQPLAEYRTSMCKALGFDLRRISVLPLGDELEGDAAVLRDLARYLAAFYTTRVEIEQRRPMPDDAARRATRGYGRQYRAEDVLRAVARDIPEHAVARLAVTSDDLFADAPGGGELEFVFGMGGSSRRVAVVSLARYRMRFPTSPADATLTRRALKVGAHEVGHVFGLAHCQTWACLMNGSNSLEESDARPVHLCPECLEKLAWHLDLDIVLWYRMLADLYRELGWTADAAFAARRSASVGSYPRPGKGARP